MLHDKSSALGEVRIALPQEGDLPIPSKRLPNKQRGRLRWGLTIGLVVLALAALFADTLYSGVGRDYLIQRFQTFVTIFLGIFIEAGPFLLAGSIVSGLIDVFVDQSMIDRYLPKRALPAALAGACMGMIFPVCECGVVPVTRRLYEKGLPLPIGAAFLLAAPAVNPVVIISTYAAFGWGPVLWGRIGFSILVAVIVGLTFQFAQPKEILRPDVSAAYLAAASRSGQSSGPKGSVQSRLHQSLLVGGDDFLDMSRYLIAGSILAATMQTVVPQSILLSIGQGPIISVLAMQALAFVLSICSTIDAFVALAFAGTFTTGSIITFLTFGPMVDIKSIFMFTSVFQKRTVLYLVLLPLVLTFLIGVAWNLNIGM